MPKSTKPMIRIHNTETDEVIDREMTKTEFDVYTLDLENYKDFVKIYSGTGATTNPIATYTGNQLPSKLTIPSSAVYIEFSSDYQNTPSLHPPILRRFVLKSLTQSKM